jgi:hypothetical protein
VFRSRNALSSQRYQRNGQRRRTDPRDELSVQAASTGIKNVYAQVLDSGMVSNAWQALGTWEAGEPYGANARE